MAAIGWQLQPPRLQQSHEAHPCWAAQLRHDT